MSRNTWDRERFMYERDRDRYGDEQHSADDRYERRYSRPIDDDIVIRDSRRVYYDDEPSRSVRHRSPPAEVERDRRVVVERERRRSPSPPNRPAFLRRQSSLDTFDRRRGFHHEEERYGPPARREDFRPRPYEPIPLPRTRALPPPRGYEGYDDIRVSEPDFYGDDEYRSYPERIREREIIRTKKRDHSPSVRSGRTRSHRASTVRSSSRSSTTTSSSASSSGGTTVTVKSEYPKKGKTRVPARLVSKRALIDLGYPFVEEGNTVVVLKALGQDNIDDLLKLSEDYKKSELEVNAARSEAGNIIEERREETIIEVPAQRPPPMALPPPPIAQQPPPPPFFVNHPPPQQGPVEFMEKRTVIRDVSPARSYTTSASGTTSTSATPYISERHRSRSRSRSHREIRSEIRDLQQQLEKRRHREGERELIKAERLSSGELVLYEEEVEKIEEPRRGVRIEKDKKGPPPGLVRAMLATLT
ncbi:hypothetical protein M406DRAFT_99779 [Cryphonectria parasitica EP155]|uniref:DUF8035 domain-containing protein n=1 Tax=Cryphonectria parasitica (strain ATCC 38755 / EP155) TaxID=660469 RepID=A0A9P4XV97_CRYP1|nr:uncharacterized protein M406DRAFT_99779 [Cryphonectria parasitica EP155]KAF3761395.1 hypothetical protein M406DRAFT_99779 [Cryphonectria parasitica EP155]